MPVKHQNFEFKYLFKGKPIFAPTKKCREVGNFIIQQASKCFTPPGYFFHLRSGGHIAALHLHRENNFFFKTDISNFFYNCGRNRVAQCLKNIGLKDHQKYARWSCVKNPYGNSPSYSLPYGFTQSPILASMILNNSSVGRSLSRIHASGSSISLYMDDIIISDKRLSSLEIQSSHLLDSFLDSPFSFNKEKTINSSDEMIVFNCNLSNGNSSVTSSRVNKFYSSNPSGISSFFFEKYCENVIG